LNPISTGGSKGLNRRPINDPKTQEQYSPHIPALHTLAALDRANLSYHECIAKRGEIFYDSELQQDSVIRNFRITQPMVNTIPHFHAECIGDNYVSTV